MDKTQWELILMSKNFRSGRNKLLYQLNLCGVGARSENETILFL